MITDLTPANGFGPKHSERMARWFGLRPTTARACLMTTAGKQHRRFPCPGCDGIGLTTVMDHASSWLAPDGRRVVVAEPYDLTSGDLAALRQRADDLELVVERLPISAWYPGQTHAWAAYRPGPALARVPEDGAVVQVTECEAVRAPGLPVHWDDRPRPVSVHIPAHLRPPLCPECDGPALPGELDFRHDASCEWAAVDWAAHEADLS